MTSTETHTAIPEPVIDLGHYGGLATDRVEVDFNDTPVLAAAAPTGAGKTSLARDLLEAFVCRVGAQAVVLSPKLAADSYDVFLPHATELPSSRDEALRLVGKVRVEMRRRINLRGADVSPSPIARPDAYWRPLVVIDNDATSTWPLVGKRLDEIARAADGTAIYMARLAQAFRRPGPISGLDGATRALLGFAAARPGSWQAAFPGWPKPPEVGPSTPMGRSEAYIAVGDSRPRRAELRANRHTAPSPADVEADLNAAWEERHGRLRAALRATPEPDWTEGRR